MGLYIVHIQLFFQVLEYVLYIFYRPKFNSTVFLVIRKSQILAQRQVDIDVAIKSTSGHTHAVRRLRDNGDIYRASRNCRQPQILELSAELRKPGMPVHFTTHRECQGVQIPCRPRLLKKLAYMYIVSVTVCPPIISSDPIK